AFSVSCRTLEDHLEDGAHAPSGRWKWTGTMPRPISLTDPSSTATCCCCCCLPATTVLHVNARRNGCGMHSLFGDFQSFTFPEHNPQAAANVYSCMDPPTVSRKVRQNIGKRGKQARPKDGGSHGSTLACRLL
ncbi:unnamed protein product, partial [Musa textilis]